MIDDDFDDGIEGIDDFSEDEFSTSQVDETVKLLLDKDTNITSEYSTTTDEKTDEKKKKRVKKIVDPFVKIAKKYFSSLHARNSKYAIFYFNEEYKDKIIFMSNKAKSTFEDYLFQYRPGDLSFQIVSCKNDDLSIIKDKLKIQKGICTLVNLNALRTYLNIALKYKDIEVLPLQFAKTDNHDLYLKVIDSVTGETFIERYGLHYHNWRIIYLLQNVLRSFMDISTKDCTVSIPVKYEDLKDRIYQNLIVFPIDTKQFLYEEKKVFDYLEDNHQTPLFFIDGKDIICVKEYLKKLKNDYTLKIQIYVSLPDKCLFYRTYFEDEDTIVISCRPYVGVYPFCRSAKEFTV